MWKIIKRFIRGSQYASITIGSEHWLAHFNNVLNPKTPLNRAEWKIPDTANPDDPILDCPISSQEVSGSLAKLKNGKAAGADSIIPEMLKATHIHTAALLAFLFSKILDFGIYPTVWAKSIIVPLFKGKGSPKVPSNYRGISLLPCVSKIFTKILNWRLMAWLASKKVIVEEQAGFRQNYSTIDNCFILETLIESRLKKKGQKLYTCYIDFRKAFDYVPRSALWFKLYKIGIRGKFLQVLINMYQKCKFSIRVGETAVTLDEGAATMGLFQGCSLSSTLFQVFINDLTEFCSAENPMLSPTLPSKYAGRVDAPLLFGTAVPTLLFADDVSLLSSSIPGLQRMINRVSEYASYWGLEINADKTECMVFRRGGRLSKSETWNLNGNEIKIVKQFKYLGIWFSSCHSWSFHTKTVIERAKKVVLLMRRLIYAVGDLPLKFWWHIFDTAVAPISLYGSELWGYKASPDIDKVDYKFAKLILRLPQCATSSALLLMMDRHYTSYWKAKHRMLQYWAKLIYLPESRLVKKAYREQLALSSEGVDCWATRVKAILSEQGMKEYWDSQRVPSKKIFSRISKQELCDQARGEFIAEAHTMRSLNELICQQGLNTEREEVLQLPPAMRRLIIAAKLNLPIFINFSTIEGARVKTCKVCRAVVENSWRHLLWDCPPLRAPFRDFRIEEKLSQPPDISIIYNAKSKDLQEFGKFLLECEKISKAKSGSNENNS